MAQETWRKLTEFPLYEMNSSGDIRRAQSKKKTAPDASVANPSLMGKRYRLTNDTGRHLVWARTLQKKTFPEMFKNA